MDDGHSQEEYLRQVLEAYRKTPGTMGTVRRADHMLAMQLYQRGVSASVVENAFALAAARRLMRPADAPPSDRQRRCDDHAGRSIHLRRDDALQPEHQHLAAGTNAF